MLRAEGRTSIRGPYNPSINDECGLLVKGFEIPPCMGLTWNPSWYPDLLAGCGFQAVWKSFGFLLPLHRLEPPQRIERIVQRAAKRANVTLRPIKMKELEKELEIVREVYNSTLSRNWGSLPISREDLLGAADDMRAFADPDLILIAEMKGKNVGVALTLPDFNEILARTRHTPHWLRLPHIFWLMKTRRIRDVRLLVYGIAPEYRDIGGLHAWLLFEQFVRAKAGYHSATLGWIEEANTEILENSRFMGAFLRQEWRVYEKSLG